MNDISPPTDAASPALPKAAVFLDLEMLAGVVRDPAALDLEDLMDTVAARWRPIVQTAYADWGPFAAFRALTYSLGFDQVQTTPLLSGGSAAAVRIAVDALEAAVLGRRVDAVVLIAPGPDLLPLVRALKRHGVRVVAVGRADAVAAPVREECDSFIACDPTRQLAAARPLSADGGAGTPRTSLLRPAARAAGPRPAALTSAPPLRRPPAEPASPQAPRLRDPTPSPHPADPVFRPTLHAPAADPPPDGRGWFRKR
jgi:hypothetical protein